MTHDSAREVIAWWLGKAYPSGAGQFDLAHDLLTALQSAGYAVEAADTIARLRERVAKLEARLEIDHYFEHAAGEEMKRVEIPPAERDNWPDGIECRDETIKLLKEHKDELKAELSSLKAAGTRADGIAADQMTEREKVVAFLKADAIEVLKDGMEDYAQALLDAAHAIAAGDHSSAKPAGEGR